MEKRPTAIQFWVGALKIWQKNGWSESHQTPPPDSFGVDFFDKRNLLYGWSTISISTFKTRRYLALGDFRKLGVEFFKASGNLSDFKITDCSRGLPLWWQFHFTLEIFFAAPPQSAGDWRCPRCLLLLLLSSRVASVKVMDVLPLFNEFFCLKNAKLCWVCYVVSGSAVVADPV